MGCLAGLSADGKPWEVQQPQCGVERVSVHSSLDWNKQMDWKLWVEDNEKRQQAQETGLTDSNNTMRTAARAQQAEQGHDPRCCVTLFQRRHEYTPTRPR